MQENPKPLRGRPNQGKTQTIKERKVDVYLPTQELVEDWRRVAESAGMSLSKYVFEVVERHRRRLPETAGPSKEAVKRMEELEKDLASLQVRYDTLDLAPKRTEVELARMSVEYSKALVEAVDSEIAKGMIQVFADDAGRALDYFEVLRRMGIDEGDNERIAEWTFAKDFLVRVGVLEHAGMTELRWKHADMRQKLSAKARRMASLSRARKHP